MRLSICLAVVVLFGCSQVKKESVESTQSKSFTLAQLEGEWQMLTDWGDGQQVIFRPCDADNRTIQVYSDTLVIGWGQDATIGLIKSFYTEEDGRIILKVADLEGDTDNTYIFQLEDEKGKLARWWMFGNDEADFFVHEDRAQEYSSYEQPCEECWEDCE